MKISVAMCTYNGERFLREQLASIVQQARPVDEVIICDDGSIDSTVEIVAEFSKQYPFIRLFQNQIKLGVVKNFEKALKLCSGDLILLSDQDDVWMPERVQRVIEYFIKNTNELAVIHDANLINDNGENIGETLWESLLFSPSIAKEKVNIFNYQLMYRNVVTGACLAIRREALSLVTPIVIHPHLLHDEWIGLKLGERGVIGYIGECLISYRRHSMQQTSSIWQKPETDKEVRWSIVAGTVHKFPLEHYRHWKKRLVAMQALSHLGVQVPAQIIGEVRGLQKQALICLLKNKKLLQRKWQLFKLFVKQNENISVGDLVKL